MLPNNFTKNPKKLYSARQYRHENGQMRRTDPSFSRTCDTTRRIVPLIIDKVMTKMRNYGELDRILETPKSRPLLPGVGQMYLSQQMADVLANAHKKAKEFKDEFISTEHLLLSLLENQPIARLLLGFELTEETVMRALKDIRGAQRVDSPEPEARYQTLEKYGSDLTEAAQLGELDPVIGRDAEIRRLMQVLTRRTKNNPVLIGEAGVGKTAIVEGLAQHCLRRYSRVTQNKPFCS